jgi:hypothetical protein
MKRENRSAGGNPENHSVITPRRQIEKWLREQAAADGRRPGDEIDYDKLALRTILAHKDKFTAGPILRYSIRFTLERLADHVLK